MWESTLCRVNVFFKKNQTHDVQKWRSVVIYDIYLFKKINYKELSCIEVENI